MSLFAFHSKEEKCWLILLRGLYWKHERDWTFASSCPVQKNGSGIFKNIITVQSHPVPLKCFRIIFLKSQNVTFCVSFKEGKMLTHLTQRLVLKAWVRLNFCRIASRSKERERNLKRYHYRSILSCGLYYKSCMIIIYDRNHSTIVGPVL
jgi:hypothetical protein